MGLGSGVVEVNGRGGGGGISVGCLEGGGDSGPLKRRCLGGAAPDEFGVEVVVAAEGSGQESGLDVWDEAEGHLFLGEGVEQLVLLSFLIGGDDGLAGGVVHGDGA